MTTLVDNDVIGPWPTCTSRLGVGSEPVMVYGNEQQPVAGERPATFAPALKEPEA